jgi:hypothetical protein
VLAAVRRAVAVGAATGALLSAGCYGMTRISDEPSLDADVVTNVDADPDAVVSVDADPDVVVSVDADPDAVVSVDADPDADVLPPLSLCEPEFRLSGEMAPPAYFTCPGDPPPPEREQLPIYLGDGHLCDAGPSVAWFTLAEDARVRLGLAESANAIALTLLDGEGREIVQIGPGPACVEAEMHAGAVGLSASLVEPGDGGGYFEFYLDFPEDPAP